MNDVRHLCEVTLDVDAPPLREAEQVLAIASRAAARRDRVVAASVGLAGVTVVAALVTPALLPARPPAAAPAVAAPALTTSAGVPAAPPVPGASVPATHDRVVYDLLVAALPAGYEWRSRYAFAGSSQSPFRLEMPALAGPVRIHMTAFVVVTDGHGEGQLWAAFVGDGNPVPAGDGCAQPGVGRDCRVMDVGGVPVSVWREDDGEGGDVLVARRYLQGGYLMVVARRNVPDYRIDTTLPPDAVGGPQSHDAGRRPALAAAFIDVERLAALAGNPAMLP
ncbi:hypothetical protein AB0K00_15045 [Dactylosporangium sp. NPDC049525]|uniref:hypothetical protein n=1 Tax=Dactylosporangium sp. NPDC049525 TaxID=3154730 RepID=UPI00343FA1BC